MYIKKVKQVCNILFFHEFKTKTENKKRDRFISVEFCLSNIKAMNCRKTAEG